MMAIDHPDAFRIVHGLDTAFSDSEVKSIIYLSQILDGYQHYYEQRDASMQKFRKETQAETEFIHAIFKREDNVRRWEIIKKINYGTRDRDFIEAVDEIIEMVRGDAL